MWKDMLVVVEHSKASLDIESGSLRLRMPDQPLQRIPLRLVGLLVIIGNLTVSCKVWRNLSVHHIPTVLFPARGPMAATWLGAGLSLSMWHRVRQHSAASRAKRRLEIAGKILLGKLEAQKALAGLWLTQMEQREMPGSKRTRVAMEKVREVLAQRCRQLSKISNLEELRGVEGRAAVTWFQAFARLVQPEWKFTGRNRRPPRDPVNALLSLGYTLLTHETCRWLLSHGLDPSVGFLHAESPNRPTLALDLVEPLRPGVDAMVLHLVQGSMKPSHFSNKKEEGCRLKKAGRAIFFQTWSTWREAWPLLHPQSPGSSASGRAFPTLNAVSESQFGYPTLPLRQYARKISLALIHELKSGDGASWEKF